MAKQMNNLLTIKKKVLIYLYSIPNKYEESWDAPFSLTQMGIANSVGVSRQNVPRVVNTLIREEKVKARKVHIFGLKQKRYIYLLTSEGRKKSKSVLKTISEVPIDVIYSDGSRKVHPINEIPDILPFESTVLDILKEISGSELDIGNMINKRETLRKNSTFTQNELMEPKYFFGRKKEMKELEAWHSSDNEHILIITGIAGIGKSTFLTKAACRWKNTQPVYTFKIHPWTGLGNLLENLASFFLHYGIKELDYFVKNNEKLNFTELQVVMDKAMKETNAILIFDDCHNADDDTSMLFSILFEILTVIKKGKMVCIGRSMPPFYDRGKAMVSGLVKDILLEGLDKEECSELLNELGLGNDNLDDLFRNTKGHPLFIELSKGKPVGESKDIKKYILDEYMENLEEAERELLKQIAVFRYPVEAMAFEPHYLVLRSMLSKGVLHEMPNGTYLLHDIIKDYLYKIQRKKQLHRNHSEAAEFYIEQDDPPSILEAIYHLIMAEHLDLAVELIVEHGRAMICVGHSSNLCDYIKTLLEEHETLKDKERALLISILADCLVFMGEWDGALQQFDALIELAAIAEMKELSARAYMGRGKIHLLRDETDLSISNFKTALSMYIELEDDEGVAETMYQQGVIYEREGDYHKALEMFNECAQRAKNINDQAILARSLNASGRVYILGGNYAMAMELMEEALDYFLLLKDQRELAKVYTGMGVCSFEARDIPKAIYYHSKAAEIAGTIGDVRIQGHVLVNLASSYIEKPDLMAAKDNLDTAKDIFMKLGEKRRLASVYMTYTVIYNFMERWDDAAEALDISIQLMKDVNDDNGLARANLRYGILYKNMGKVKMARDRMLMAQDYYKKIDNKNKIEEVARLLDDLGSNS